MTERKKVTDPLADARWGQVRGDEAGIRAEWDGRGAEVESETRPAAPVDDEDAGLGQGEEARNRLTGEAGDPGGER